MTDQISEQESGTDRVSADIGIVCTHQEEIQPFLKRLDRKRKYMDQGVLFRGGFLDETIRVAVVEAGPGFAVHRTAAQILIEEHQPKWTIAVGFSSGLTETLRTGDLSLANQICDTHGNSLDVKCPIPSSKRIIIGRHVVADTHPLGCEQKQHLAQSSQAIAVDTTSLAVAQVCSEQTARFLSIRAVVDAAGDDIRNEVAESIFAPTQKTGVSAFTGVLSQFRQPADVKQWQQQARQSAGNLDHFLTGVIKQLVN